jgi:hypothetical protein
MANNEHTTMKTEESKATWVSEDWLAQELNLPIKKIRAYRPELAVAAEMRDGAMCWRVEDACELADKLGVAITLPAEKNAPEEVYSEELTVASVARGADGRHFPNPHVIHAKRGNGELVTVRVVDSAKYRPTLRLTGKPMTFKARKGDGNWWVLVGREPRFIAQW